MRNSTDARGRPRLGGLARAAAAALLACALAGVAPAGPATETAPEPEPGAELVPVVPPPPGARFLLVSRVGTAFARTYLRPPIEDPEAYSRTAGEREGGESAAALPTVFALARLTPNPVAGRSRLGFDLPVASRVRFEVLDVAGRVTRTLLEGTVEAGRHSFDWDGTAAGGRTLTPGIYFLRMDARSLAGAGGIQRVDKVLVLR